jgi:hypothetical protein
MRNLFSMVTGGILLFATIAFSSCASEGGGAATNNQRPSPNDGVTIGPATVATGTTEFESPWPFGPLGMD